MLDFGDYNPSLSKYHFSRLTAYDGDGAIVDEMKLEYESDGKGNPTFSDYGNLLCGTGDAIDASEDEPGNWTWYVSGSGITRVELFFGDGFDPNIAFDTLSFTKECPDYGAILGSSPEVSSSSASTCTRIQDGTLLRSDGVPITTGYDEWGYNYQAHMFNGYYCDAYRDAAWCQPYKEIGLMMKWNDAWLSNKDCDSDGLLDRYYGFDSYIGSGAWLTNHQWGTYIDGLGEEINWNYFVKIVAAPADAYADGGIWYTADGTEIGPEIWGAFAIIQQVENDPGLDSHGILYNSEAPTGFGFYKP
jgi:hypothetical protein